MSIRSAIFHVLNEVGPRTSLRELVDRTSNHMNDKAWSFKPHSLAYACNVRNEWKRQKGVKIDARTHADIKRRNMFRDDKIARKNYDALSEFVNGLSYETRKKLRKVVSPSRFHSVEQLSEALNTIERHRKALQKIVN